MRRTLLTMLLAMAPAAALGAQSPLVEGQLPRDVRRMAIDRWNGPNEFRAEDRSEIGATSEVRGDVAVLRGPLVLAGRVTGTVLVINGDVIMRPTAHVDGDLIVIGGDVDGRRPGQVDGAVRIYRQTLAYKEEGDRIVALNDDGTQQPDENWWRRLERKREDNWSEVLRVVQAGPYNRVEGLPVQLGPALGRRTPWGSVRFDAAAVVRTASTFESDKGDVGHDLGAEVRVGQERAIGLGARVFNTVEPIEAWQLSNVETALAAFLARRDYRDYYQHHGANGFVTLYGAGDLSLSASYGEERWASRVQHNAFSLFNQDRDWRTNPAVDEGLFHLADLALNFDTRTDPDDPWSGWYLSADVERGSGTLTSGQAATSASAGGHTEYTRGFFDFRRYNRLGPSAQLNMRVVVGGWLDGDHMPLERRLSVDGPGTLPGFGFRSAHTGVDVANCNVGLSATGLPARCERIALAQVEYRGDLKLDWVSGFQDWPRRFRRSHGDVTWVLFADAGRGWLIGPRDSEDLTYGRETLPPLSTFRTDIGLGLDIGGIGVYCAKALSSGSEPANFFVRLRHRF